MPDIYIRDINPEVKVKLQKIAADKKMSLNALLKNVLTDYSLSPETRAVGDKYKDLFNSMTTLFVEQQKQLAETITENTYVLQKIEERLDEIGEG